MLAIAPSAPSYRKTITANLLPASIKHDGPIPFDARYWSPQPLSTVKPSPSSVADSTRTAANNITNDQKQPTEEGAEHSPQQPHSQSQSQTQIQTQRETRECYLRGRRLLGRAIPVPAGYEGLILCKTENKVPSKPPTVEQLRRMEGDWEGDDEEDVGMGLGMEDEELEVKLLEERGRFEEVVVWGHEVVPEEGEDVYLRGLGEWVGFAEVMHDYKEPQTG